MSWWVWVLIAWAVLAVGVGVVAGMGIRAAERRELGHGRGGTETPDDED